MLADTANLYVDLALKNQNALTSGLAKASKGIRNLSLDTGRLKLGLAKVSDGLKLGLVRGLAVGAGAVGFLALNIKKGIDSLDELNKLTEQTRAVMKSTHQVAGLYTMDILNLSNKYEDLTTIDNKVIQGGENVLLTFTNVRKKAFEPALAAALNLSVAMGQNLQSSIVQIGKALSDPIKGITALTRVGVTFTEQQKKKIKSLVAEGKLYEAQKIILKELDKEFGGQAKAAADSYAGAQARLKDAVENLQVALAMGLLPALTKITKRAAEFLKDPAIVARVQAFGEMLGNLFNDKNIDQGASGVRKFFGYLADLPWGVIKDGIQSSAEGAKRAIDLFKGLPPDLQKALIGLLAVNKLTGGLLASGIGDLVKFTLGSLKTIYATSVTVIGPQTGTPGTGVPGTGSRTDKIKSVATDALATAGIATVIALIASEGPPAISVLKDFGNKDIKQGLQDFGPGMTSLLSTLADVTGKAMGVNDLWGKIVQTAPTPEQVANATGKTAGKIDKANPALDAAHAIIAATQASVASAQKQIDLQTGANDLLKEQTYGSKAIQRILGLENQAVVAGNRGNATRAARLQAKAEQLAHKIGTTTAAVNAGTATLKNKNFAPKINISTQFNVSAVAVATSIQRVVLGHKVGFQ